MHVRARFRVTSTARSQYLPPRVLACRKLKNDRAFGNPRFFIWRKKIAIVSSQRVTRSYKRTLIHPGEYTRRSLLPFR